MMSELKDGLTGKLTN